MILEDLTTAADRADQLAVELCIVRPELRSRGYAIRVTDDGEKEVYRTPLEAMSSGHARSHSGLAARHSNVCRELGLLQEEAAYDRTSRRQTRTT